MPVYTPFTWQDEVPASSPLRFKITLANGTVLAEDATIELVTGITAQGTPVNAARLNALEQGLSLTQLKCCVVARDTQYVFNLTPYTSAFIPWDAEKRDEWGGFTLSDPTKITVTETGLYMVVTTFGALRAGSYNWPFLKNGVVDSRLEVAVSPSANHPNVRICGIVEMTAGDYFQIRETVTANVNETIPAGSWVAFIKID